MFKCSKRKIDVNAPEDVRDVSSERYLRYSACSTARSLISPRRICLFDFRTQYLGPSLPYNQHQRRSHNCLNCAADSSRSAYKIPSYGSIFGRHLRGGLAEAQVMLGTCTVRVIWYSDKHPHLTYRPLRHLGSLLLLLPWDRSLLSLLSGRGMPETV